MSLPRAIPARMRALVLSDYRRITVEERPVPAVGDHDVLVRTIATGICGSDVHGYTGENGRRSLGQVMGHETVGVVAATGPQVEALQIGQQVVLNPNMTCGVCDACRDGDDQICSERRVIGVDPTISAAFADYFAAPAANLIPFAGDSEVGALVEPLAVGFHAATQGELRPGQRVLVVGGGPIGQAVALGCRRQGVDEIVVSEPIADRRELVQGLGFTAVEPADLGSQLPADVTIDAVGTGATIAAALTATRKGGTVVLVGMAEPTIALPAYELSTAERRIVGAFCYSAQHFASTAAWASGRGQELTPLISRLVEPREAPAVFAALATGADGTSKVLVTFADGMPGQPSPVRVDAHQSTQ